MNSFLKYQYNAFIAQIGDRIGYEEKCSKRAVLTKINNADTESSKNFLTY